MPEERFGGGAVERAGADHVVLALELGERAARALREPTVDGAVEVAAIDEVALELAEQLLRCGAEFAKGA